MWKGLSDSARKPWEDKAKAQKDAYDKFILSPEGAAALQAYKAQVKEAKDDIKGKKGGALRAVSQPVIVGVPRDGWKLQVYGGGGSSLVYAMCQRLHCIAGVCTLNAGVESRSEK